MKFLKRILVSAVLLAIAATSFTGCTGSTGNAELQFNPPKKGQDIATMTIKDFGEVKIMLFKKQAPKAVENFITHANNGYYDGLTFHRVIPDFMIQGGDPDGTGGGGESIWGEPFEDEFTAKLRNFSGALSMANSGPETNGSQFFIVNAPSVPPEAIPQYVEATKAAREQIKGGLNPRIDPKYGSSYGESTYNEADIAKYEEVGGTPHLDRVHTVFGQVYEGMDVIAKVMEVGSQNGETSSPVIIDSIKISQAE